MTVVERVLPFCRVPDGVLQPILASTNQRIALIMIARNKYAAKPRSVSPTKSTAAFQIHVSTFRIVVFKPMDVVIAWSSLQIRAFVQHQTSVMTLFRIVFYRIA
jgi:hypothetical protein